MAKLVDFKTDRFCFPNHVKAFNMVSSLYLHKHGYVFGAQAIFDMKGFTLAHLARFDLIAVKHLFFYIQVAIFDFIKDMHCFIPGSIACENKRAAFYQRGIVYRQSYSTY